VDMDGALLTGATSSLYARAQRGPRPYSQPERLNPT